jgi:hypothetical protein
VKKTTNTPTTIYKIRVTGDVLDTANATRQLKIEGRTLIFGREPLYLQAETLPEKIATDPYLDITAVDTVPPGTEVIDLKAERVQEV